MEDEIFSQLKPRLQKLLLDQVFTPFYQTFDTILDGCDMNFKRVIQCDNKYYRLQLILYAQTADGGPILTRRTVVCLSSHGGR